MAKISRYSNVQMKMEGTKLVIEVETSTEKVECERSASGKSMVIATTGGAQKIGNLSVNLTVYTK